MAIKAELSNWDRIKGIGYMLGWIIGTTVSALGSEEFYKTKDPDAQRRKLLADELCDLVGKVPTSTIFKIADLANPGK